VNKKIYETVVLPDPTVLAYPTWKIKRRKRNVVEEDTPKAYS